MYLGSPEVFFCLELNIPHLFLMPQINDFALLFERLKLILHSFQLGPKVLVANIYTILDSSLTVF